MTPQRRIALASAVAAAGLIGVKLGVGLETGSLGFVSEAIHSASDLVAAALTFFAVGVAGRPADRGHQYGHGKAEHLAALGEAAILIGASLFVVVEAATRLASNTHPIVETPWYAFAVVAGVIAVDLSRAAVSRRGARRYSSPALAANFFHFASDAAGSLAVLVGLLLVSAGHVQGDSAAALAVAALVLAGAGRLIAGNVDVLMDRAPASARDAALRAMVALEPRVRLRRLRMRQSAGRHFADIVVGVAPAVLVAEGHELADQVEAAVQRAVPGTDVVVHVEPDEAGATLHERAVSAALRIPGVREIHNVNVLTIDGRVELSLHLRLPGELSLDDAHEIASTVEAAIHGAAPELDAVETHIEPLAADVHDAETMRSSDDLVAKIGRLVSQTIGRDPRTVRIVSTDAGLVVFLTLSLDPSTSLDRAHADASVIEELVRKDNPTVASVIVHTEP